ncbi:MAG: type II toxin-antitoxin system RelE/ParE family toxin [Bacteroidales bacterium]|nr:type II toxin-antitoxin system RelE/ParE family toxin [Bacteroidales bacterium]
MREIQWLKEAENELASIIGYVLDIRGQNVALQVYDNIISQIDLLLDFPELGTTETTHKYNGKILRVLHSKHVRVFYYIKGTKIIIVLLWNNRMDDKTINKILSER